MKVISPFIVIVVLAMGILSLPLSARTFTNDKGQKIEAKLIGVKGKKAELKLDSTGKVVLYPISRLSKSDRDYIKLWMEVEVPDTGKEDEEAKPEEKKQTDEKEERRRRIMDLVEKEKAEPLKLDAIVTGSQLWSKKLADFQKQYKKNGFEFMSASKKGIRSEGEGFTLFGKKAGEVVMRSQAGMITSATISLYNRGDDGETSTSVVNKTRNHVIMELNEKTGVAAEHNSKSGTVKLESWLWQWKDSILVMEQSVSKETNKTEFLRIKMKSKNARSEGMASRSQLDDNLVKDEATGDVYIEDVPMIDQGKKGYCAVASAARVYRYYGLDVDQHELAQIAGTGPDSGTSLGEMVAALKKVTRHVHSRVLILYEYPKGLSKKDEDYDARDYKSFYMEYRRDLKAYNKIAKKRGEDTFKESRESLVHPENFRRKCKPEIYREVMMAKSSYPRFKNKIYEYIDQGLPVGWCLQLGMFKEGDLPQSFGGHMRLIIGYNKKKDELIYTDSWGKGHGMKRMPAGNAFCMTTAILALPPTK